MFIPLVLKKFALLYGDTTKQITGGIQMSNLNKRILIVNKLKDIGLYAIAKKIFSISYAFESIIFTIKKIFRKITGYSKDLGYLKKYKMIHKNERCFIIATGPSLKIEDLEKIKKEYTFGVNSLALLYDKTNYRATYYCIGDYYVYNRLKELIDFGSITNLFLPTYFRKFFQIPANANPYPLNYMNNRNYDGDKSYKPKYRFSDDLFLEVCAGNTITYICIELAVYMGFKEIYLLGVDCDYSGKKQHVIDTGDIVFNNPESRMIEAYKKAKKYADEHGIKIYNATRGGKLEVFERVDFDSLFPEDDKK